jgi:NAD(P)-dependent dehydrogenase (short-subunit alcohol dehydrogenase family)
VNLHLDGRIVLVTGASSGIGRAVARVLHHEGATVVATARDPQRLDTACDELGIEHRLAVDLRDPAGVERLCDAVEAVGPTYGLVANAGQFAPSEFASVGDAEWQAVLDLNLMAAVRLARRLLPGMIQRRTGRVVLVSSEAGVRPSADNVPYAVSKTALLGLGRALAEVAKGSGVGVNTLVPGATWTEGAAGYQQAKAERAGLSVERHLERYFAERGSDSLIGRFLDVDEVAQTCAFYCSPVTSGVTGAALRVDGGVVRSIL